MSKIASLALTAASLLACACTAGSDPYGAELASPETAPAAVIECSGGNVLELYEEWPDSVGVHLDYAGETMADAPAPDELLPLDAFVSLNDRDAAAAGLLQEVLEQRSQELCAIFFDDAGDIILRKRPGRTR